MTKRKHGRIMNKVEGALHNLLNHETPVRSGAQARTPAEEQAYVHGYARGWEDRQEADATSERGSTK